MRKNRSTLRKRTSYIFAIMMVFATIFIGCIIYCINGYSKTLKSYSDGYYHTAMVSASLDGYSVAMYNYTQFGGEYYLSQAQEKYNDFSKAFTSLYSTRFEYPDNIRYSIESVNNELSMIENSMTKISDYSRMDIVNAIYSSDISGYISETGELISGILQSQVDISNSIYARVSAGGIACEIIMVLAFVGFVSTVAYFIYFIKKRIAVPVAEISEWSILFREGYCDMAELKYDVDDEIGDMVTSFNSVRTNLIKANQMKHEYEEAVQKLRNEEEYKKKFVQQLYEEKKEKETIFTAAQHDGLTGLYNRRSFDEIVDDFVSKRPGHIEGALYLIDMDNFKNVNDSLGHLSGDEALKTLAGAMRIVFPGAYLGRYGGDEFIAFVPQFDNYEQLNKYGELLCKKMNRKLTHENKAVMLSVSVGIATTDNITDYSELYMKADKALYTSKESGRNRYTLLLEN